MSEQEYITIGDHTFYIDVKPDGRGTSRVYFQDGWNRETVGLEDSLWQEVDRLRKSNLVLSTQVKQQGETAQRLADENSRLRNHSIEKAIKEVEIRALLEEKADLQTQLNEAEAEVKRLQEKLEQAKLGKVIWEAAGNSKRAKASEEKIAQLQDSLKAAEQCIEELQRTVKRLGKECKQKDKLSDKQFYAIRRLRKELSDARESVEQYKNLYAKYYSLHGQALDTWTEYSKKAKELEKERDELRRQLETLKNGFQEAAVATIREELRKLFEVACVDI